MADTISTGLLTSQINPIETSLRFIALPKCKESWVLPRASQLGLVVFQSSGEFAAVPLEAVERIEAMADLIRPPGIPSALEGILNVGGAAVPVLRLDRILPLPPQQRTGLYSMLIVFKSTGNGRWALLVDRVHQIAYVEDSLLPVGKENSFNACAEGAASVGRRVVPVLSPSRILLEKERTVLAEFQAISQQRLQEWEAKTL